MERDWSWTLDKRLSYFLFVVWCANHPNFIGSSFIRKSGHDWKSWLCDSPFVAFRFHARSYACLFMRDQKIRCSRVCMYFSNHLLFHSLITDEGKLKQETTPSGNCNERSSVPATKCARKCIPTKIRCSFRNVRRFFLPRPKSLMEHSVVSTQGLKMRSNIQRPNSFSFSVPWGFRTKCFTKNWSDVQSLYVLCAFWLKIYDPSNNTTLVKFFGAHFNLVSGAHSWLCPHSCWNAFLGQVGSCKLPFSSFPKQMVFMPRKLISANLYSFQERGYVFSVPRRSPPGLRQRTPLWRKTGSCAQNSRLPWTTNSSDSFRNSGLMSIASGNSLTWPFETPKKRIVLARMAFNFESWLELCKWRVGFLFRHF